MPGENNVPIDSAQNAATISEYLAGWRLLFVVVLLSALGTIGKILLEKEPINWRRFSGEIIMSLIAGIGIYAFGMMQDFTAAQILFFGVMGGIGTWRVFEWFVQIFKRFREVS